MSGVAGHSMPITFSCPCGQQLQTSEDQAGTQVACPRCGQGLLVPRRGVAVAGGKGHDPGYSAATPPSPKATMPPPLPPFQGGATGDRLQWFVLRNGTREGPYLSSSMQQWTASGQLLPGTLVWREGLAGWQPLASVPELAIGLTGRPAQGVDTPVTSLHLPLMANAICVFCLVGYPILWVIANLSCCLTGPSYHEDSPFFAMEVFLGLVSAVVDLGIGIVLAWGGWQLRSQFAAGRTIVLAGLWSSLASSLLLFVVGMAVILAAAAQATDQSVESSPAGIVIGFLMLPIGLCVFAFEILALIWLLRHRDFAAQRS